MLSLSKKQLSYVFIIFLIVGAVGMITNYNTYFEGLSFYNLLLTFTLLLFSVKFNPIFIKILTSLFLIGFTAEVIGVHTNLLFGNYSYVKNLGPKILDVPVMIGINWAVLSFGAWSIVKDLKFNNILKFALAAFIMVLFDIVMEPVAIELDFWKWNLDQIPALNYITWFLISFIQMIVISKSKIKNFGISRVIIFGQFIFFSWLLIWI